MARLTRDTIEKLLDAQVVGNFSSLTTLGKSKDNSRPQKDLTKNLHNGSVSNPLAEKTQKEMVEAQASVKLGSGLTNQSANSSIDCYENLGEAIKVEAFKSAQSNSVSNPLPEFDRDEIHKISEAKIDKSPDNKMLQLKGNNNLFIGENGHATSVSNSLQGSPIKRGTNYVAQEALKQNPTRTDKLEDKPDRSVSDSLSINQQYDSDTEVKVGHEEQTKISFEVAQVLAGKGLNLVMHLIDLCQKNGSLITPPVFTKDLLQVVCVKPNHLRNLILRLSEKKIFKVLLHKSSKHAVRIFEFDKSTYVSLIQRKQEGVDNLVNNKHLLQAHVLNNNNVEQIVNPFQDLNLLPLEGIGFNETHLMQIFKEYEKNPRQTLSIDMIQHSIDAFAFDLKHNRIIEDFRKSPAIVLLSLLKKGIPYSSKTPEKVLTPKEEAMREYLLAQEQKHAKMLELETKTQNFVLQEWIDSLSEEELLNFNEDNGLRPQGMPEKLYQVSRRKKALANAKEYFDTIIWPQKRKEIVDEQAK